MFICEPCLKEKFTNFGFFMSQGKCEFCDTSKLCYDIPSIQLNPKEQSTLSKLLHEREQFLVDNETLIYVKNNQVIVRYNDGETLSEVTMDLNKEFHLQEFLKRLQED